MKRKSETACRFGTLLTYILFFVICTVCVFLQNGIDRYEAKAWESGPAYAINSFVVDMTIQEDCTIQVKEEINVKFLTNEGSMFYRSLAKTGAKYRNISASCDENSAFYYEVADNPDYDEYIDINCIGGVKKGNQFTYSFSYTMIENRADGADYMIIDVIGGGWSVEIQNVTVNVHFPASLNTYNVYVGHHATEADSTKVQKDVSNDGKTLTLSIGALPLAYNYVYGEIMAEPMTLEFSLPEGTLTEQDPFKITKNVIGIVIGGSICMFLSIVALLYFRKKNQLIPVVNVKAPDDMDPMKMGTWLDGTVDTEDVTSMIYYFAHKGYLHIDLQDEDNPILIKKIDKLPNTASIHEKTLFNGLFKSGNEVTPRDLAEKFYTEVAKAKMQLPTPKMYDKKSVVGFFIGGLLGGLYGFITPLIIGVNIVGGGYFYPFGFLYLLAIAIFWFLAYVRENYRYKWKKTTYNSVGGVIIGVFAVVIALMTSFFAKHFLYQSETLLIGVFSLLPALITLPALSKNQAYLDELGEIVGFKEFIVYTEEDKIKVMLEENPELYYKVLPYAQVLGVTKEWENKFQTILLEPPTWCTCSSFTVFDYMLINRCMTNAMRTAMQAPQSSAGRGGGGGNFGSFGGGGFGGGGGGVR